MKIVLINGTMRKDKSSTYNFAKSFIEKLDGEKEVKEFFLPKDMPHPCLGCSQCIIKGEDKCPHYESVSPIATALEKADIIILASPVYVLDVTGQIKSLLDHLAYRWYSHRPHPKMFNKVGIAFSTTAGAGLGHTLKTLTNQLNWWGLKRVFKCGQVVNAAEWDGIPLKKKAQANKKIIKLAKKVNKIMPKINKILPRPFTVLIFHVMKMMSKAAWKVGTIDNAFWAENGWLNGKKPWRK
ncbi:MAG: NAD(P)H-dependent oxidoreductase [Oscillospiraceae bacterium]|jgi:multimeric flavodoxin WrbA